jgi:hypothetical protein
VRLRRWKGRADGLILGGRRSVLVRPTFEPRKAPLVIAVKIAVKIAVQASPPSRAGAGTRGSSQRSLNTTIFTAGRLAMRSTGACLPRRRQAPRGFLASRRLPSTASRGHPRPAVKRGRSGSRPGGTLASGATVSMGTSTPARSQQRSGDGASPEGCARDEDHPGAAGRTAGLPLSRPGRRTKASGSRRARGQGGWYRGAPGTQPARSRPFAGWTCVRRRGEHHP